jgi:DHA1 family tetracycline resistance protein-like MFS transporter
VSLLAASLLIWGFVGSVPLLLVILAPIALTAGTLNTVLSSPLTKSVSRDEMGGTLGLAAAMQSLAGVIEPSASGALIQGVGPWSLGVVGALIMAALIP